MKIEKKQILEDIDDYESTLQTIVALTSIFEHDFAAQSIQGKKMMTSNSNVISPNTEVTPDLVTEVKDPTSKDVYGVLSELKVDLPKNKDYWMNYAEQLKKYDDDLTGWKSKIKTHDLTFVSNPLRTYDFFEYLNSTAVTSKYKFDRNVIVVQSSRMQQNDTFMLIKKESGTFSLQYLDKMLARGLGVPQIKILPIVNNMKFYDSKPTLIYTMMIIWDHIFKTYLNINQLRELERKRIIDVTVKIDDILTKLSRYAPHTNKNCIRKDWIIEAMDAFSDLGLAKSMITGTYDVKIIIHSGDTRDWLIEKFQELENKKSQKLDKYF